jgi:hypothetical protein
MAESLMDRLMQLDGSESDGTEPRICDPKRNVWLSGSPYLWSCFGERAYVFASPSQAEAILAEFPDQLAGCEVVTAVPVVGA